MDRIAAGSETPTCPFFEMKRRPLILILAAFTLSGAAYADPGFTAGFSDTTLRFDYYHAGTAAEEHFAFD